MVDGVAEEKPYSHVVKQTPNTKALHLYSHKATSQWIIYK